MKKQLVARKKAASLLNSVLSGSLPAETALKEWPDEDDESIKAAEHALIHYIDDDDIRTKDKRYEEQQLSQLRRMAEKLDNGTPIDADDIEWFAPRKLSLSKFPFSLV